MTITKAQALKELATRELEKRHALQREDLIEFIKFYFKEEKGKEFIPNWHHYLIAEKLSKVLTGEITRLIINIPPRTGKTELITKCFPVWALGKNPTLEIIATGYSANLTQVFSGQARDYYTSDTFQKVFPGRPNLRADQNTKEWWVNEKDGGYYATGVGGSITGRGANIFIIDDPIKPKEANVSDVIRTGVNNWYEDTVNSRLNNILTDSIIIIMQRTHENDLCGYLQERMKDGTGDVWEVVSVPAISEKDDEYRKEGESMHEERLPLEGLKRMKSKDPVVFSTQYQQNPIAKESQEFHEEWFKYYDNGTTVLPVKGRIFTAVDPAFSLKTSADYTSIVTAKFHEDKMYILEITHGRFDPAELEDKIVYHAKKWASEKVGVESIAAQRMIGFSLRNRFMVERIRSTVEDITQSGDKETKIRRLIPLYRNGQIFHKPGGCEMLEEQAIKFPRGAHDDVIDSVQMLYDLYELQPNVQRFTKKLEFKPDRWGRLILVDN